MKLQNQIDVYKEEKDRERQWKLLLRVDFVTVVLASYFSFFFLATYLKFLW